MKTLWEYGVVFSKYRKQDPKPKTPNPRFRVLHGLGLRVHRILVPDFRDLALALGCLGFRI